MNLKRPLNCLKNKITKIEENLNKAVKKCMQISHKKSHIWPVIIGVRQRDISSWRVM